jgi:biopolymer transport protein ExbB
MIKIFSVVATAGSGITEQLSSGISQALITTATGLVIAIPALFTHSYLESRAVSILSDIEAQILDFLHLVREHERAANEDD